MTKLITWVGGRKMFVWFLAMITASVFLGMGWVDADDWKFVLTYVTGLLFAANVGSKFQPNKPSKE